MFWKWKGKKKDGEEPGGAESESSAVTTKTGDEAADETQPDTTADGDAATGHRTDNGTVDTDAAAWDSADGAAETDDSTKETAPTSATDEPAETKNAEGTGKAKKDGAGVSQETAEDGDAEATDVSAEKKGTKGPGKAKKADAEATDVSSEEKGTKGPGKAKKADAEATDETAGDDDAKGPGKSAKDDASSEEENSKVTGDSAEDEDAEATDETSEDEVTDDSKVTDDSEDSEEEAEPEDAGTSEGIQLVRTEGTLTVEDDEFDVVSNTWIVDADSDGVIVIDPAHDAKAVLDAVGDREIYLVACTNGYNTHVCAAVEVAERDEAPIALHPRELRSWRRVHGAERRPDIEIEGGGSLEVGDLEVDVLAIPGTSNGSVGFYIAERGVVLSGDTLRKGELGTVGDGYLDYTRQLHSVGEVLLALPPDTRVLPDSGPQTTVEGEAKNFDSWVATR